MIQIIVLCLECNTNDNINNKIIVFLLLFLLYPIIF